MLDPGLGKCAAYVRGHKCCPIVLLGLTEFVRQIVASYGPIREGNKEECFRGKQRHHHPPNSAKHSFPQGLERIFPHVKVQRNPRTHEYCRHAVVDDVWNGAAFVNVDAGLGGRQVQRERQSGTDNLVDYHRQFFFFAFGNGEKGEGGDYICVDS